MRLFDPIGKHKRDTFSDWQAVISFTESMIEKLGENEHKAHWDTVDEAYLMRRLEEETKELAEALAKGDTAEIIREAADIANFAMMIADKQKR